MTERMKEWEENRGERKKRENCIPVKEMTFWVLPNKRIEDESGGS